MTTEATTDIFYPETDGMPLPDGLTQAPRYVTIIGMLRAFFRNLADCEVNGNVFIYYILNDNRRTVSPDCFVVFGLSETARKSLSLEGRNTYVMSEVGKPPDFVLEIGSESTGRVDTGSKRDLYAEIGVPEYWRYDPTGEEYYGEALVGERLVNGEYARFPLRYEDDGSVWSHSEVLNLDLWWVEGELRFWDPVGGQWLLSHEEEQDGRLAAEAGRLAAEAELKMERAVSARAEARVEEERAGRLAAEERAAELEAELRRMRGE
ncbi:MAG: Uma2 family endonuclease [Chloroflexota bacterium]|nr:Uma2 family endonuclease [Chloroflexota bacterium]